MGETEKERNGPDMGISMSSNGRTMTLLHLPLNPIRAQLLPVPLSPHLYPPRKKKSTDVIKHSLVRKMELGFISHV